MCSATSYGSRPIILFHVIPFKFDKNLISKKIKFLSLIMEQTVEDFHGCYLLTSENPKFSGRIYIGYTVDPNRRQRQHNLGVKYGGACKTAQRGPWAVVVIVYGFMTNISALQFEWAWQHPEESRRLRHVERKRSKENALAFRIRILAEMLAVRPWNRLPLTVQWIRSEYEVPFPINLQPPSHIAILSGSVKIMKLKATPTAAAGEAVSENSTRNLNHSGSRISECFICKFMVEDSHGLICLFAECSAKFHMLCLAKDFLGADTKQLIPLEGKCPACRYELLWADLIRLKKGFYKDCAIQHRKLEESFRLPVTVPSDIDDLSEENEGSD